MRGWCDPNDIFYVCGAMNMQIFCARTPARYLLVVDGGPAILFEYGRAKGQLEWNTSLLRPGIEFEELARRAWKVPDEHQASPYYCVGHWPRDVGRVAEHPTPRTGVDYPLAGCVEPGMSICLESYIGSDKSGEGVKLEDQFLILENGVENMSTYRYDKRLSA